MPDLKIHIRKGDTSQIFETHKDRVIVGRPDTGHAVDLNLTPDQRVSRRHAEFYYQDGIWWARDLGSRSGTERHRENTTITPVTGTFSVDLMPNDEITMGDSVLRMEFQTEAIDPLTTQPMYDAIDEKCVVPVNEINPPEGVSEDDHLKVSVNLMDITNNETGDAMLQLCLEKISEFFNEKAEYCNILLRKDGEIVPFASLPRGRTKAIFSYTLTRLAIQREEAFRWPAETVNVRPDSMVGITEAMYAPIIVGGQIVGVISVSTTLLDNHFTKRDVEFLTMAATAMGRPIQRDLDLGIKYKPDLYPLVFISYSHRDKEFVRRLADDLRKRFVRVWFDERLEDGASWREKLLIAIKNADALVLVVSPDSIDSEPVKWEIDNALDNKKIFPLLHRGDKAHAVINNLQRILIGDDPQSAEYSQGLGKLVESLKQHIRVNS